MSQPKFFITTPIYYANGPAHIGHAYTSLICDVMARTKRMLGYQVKFSTWTDENGQKMTQKAVEQGKEVMEFLDEIAAQHQMVRETLDISYTDFIRTTHPTHHAFTQEMLSKTKENGDIYQWSYDGLYCVWCEWFKKTTDLIEHEWKQVCPDHLKEPEHISEKNRFFALENYKKVLLDHYSKNREYCLPQHRFNEIMSLAKDSEDFSISREGSDFWVTLPFDEKSVSYIWFDALYNYVTVCEHPQDFTKNWQSVSGEETDISFRNEWEVVHVIGKDIARFHCIYRPAMLMSSGYFFKDWVAKEIWSIPTAEKINKSLIINGYFTVDGQKMSKTIGNVVDPLETLETYGRDALVYYLFSDIKIGNDGDFSRERFHATRENVLKKWRGNLVSRVLKMCKKYEITSCDLLSEDIEKTDLFESLKEIKFILAPEDWTFEWVDDLSNNLNWIVWFPWAPKEKILDTYMKEANYSWYLRDWFKLVQVWNEYMQRKEPRIAIKNPETEQHAREDLQLLLRWIKNLWVISSPFLVEWFSTLQNILAIKDDLWSSYQTKNNDEKLGEKTQYLLWLTTFSVEFGEWYLY